MNYLESHIGKAPRELSLTLPEKPSRWFSDPLLEVWDHIDDICTHGRAVWGHIYMANNLLFEEGEQDLPAGVIYSFEDAFERDPRLLEWAAGRVYGLKETTELVDTPDMRSYQLKLHSEVDRTAGYILPQALVNGAVVYDSTLMVFRSFLANGTLESMRVPLLVDKEGRALLIPHQIVPHRR